MEKDEFDNEFEEFDMPVSKTKSKKPSKDDDVEDFKIEDDLGLDDFNNDFDDDDDF